jgi:hypothetical protein
VELPRTTQTTPSQTSRPSSNEKPLPERRKATKNQRDRGLDLLVPFQLGDHIAVAGYNMIENRSATITGEVVQRVGLRFMKLRLTCEDSGRVLNIPLPDLCVTGAHLCPRPKEANPLTAEHHDVRAESPPTPLL